jgi:hypothetical protein
MQLNTAVPTHQTCTNYRQTLSPETPVPGVPQSVYSIYQDVSLSMSRSDAAEDQVCVFFLAEYNGVLPLTRMTSTGDILRFSGLKCSTPHR